MSWSLCNVSPHDIYSILRQRLLNYKFFICVWTLLMQHSSIMKAKCLVYNILSRGFIYKNNVHAALLTGRSDNTELGRELSVKSVTLDSESIFSNGAEWGRDWNRHMTYIMIDFLSGDEVWTSGKEFSKKKNLNRYCFSFVNLKTNTYLNYLEKKTFDSWKMKVWPSRFVYKNGKGPCCKSRS